MTTDLNNALNTTPISRRANHSGQPGPRLSQQAAAAMLALVMTLGALVGLDALAQQQAADGNWAQSAPTTKTVAQAQPATGA